MSASHTLPPLPELDAIASTVMRIVGLQKGAARHVAEITLEYMAQDRAALASTAAVQAALSSQAPAALHETDIYDFAGWLTTRPGVMPVGSTSEAGPMAEAVGEYIKTYPERFAALQSRQPAVPVAPVAAAAVQEGWRLVPVEFIRGVTTLAHNYSLKAEVTCYYQGVERDAFSAAYAHCGQDLAKVVAMLQASPTPPVQPDPLQGAANWLAEAIEGCQASDIAGRLSIGHNRASRLLTAAQAEGGR
jgi:hypothetical protein